MDLNEAYELYRCDPTEENMEVLYPLVWKKVKGVIGKLYRDYPDEGLVVSCTTDVLMDINKYKPGKAVFSTWVETTVRHDCLDLLRQDESGRRPHRRLSEIDDTPPAFQTYAFDKSLDGPSYNEEAQPDIDDSLIELYDRIETVLDNPEQEILELRNAGYTSAEIAEKLGIPAGTLRWKVHEITNKLKVSRA